MVEGKIEGRPFMDYWQFGKNNDWCELKYDHGNPDQMYCKGYGTYHVNGSQLSITYMISQYEGYSQNPTINFIVQQGLDTVYLAVVNTEENYMITKGVKELWLTKIAL
jgi:hypothetical protein